MSGDSSKKVKVGSRKSELALIQTRHVISLLSKLHPEKEFEIVTMSTLGDKILDIPLPKIGEKSLFTKELETALVTGCVDFVVHSLKDLPTTLPEGMAIGAVLKREDPRDALVVRKDLDSKSLSELKDDSVIGTSSLRRTAQLARTFPNLKIESIRGNLNTRMRKLDDLGKFHAIVLAQAGLCRMGWDDRITKVLECDEMLYAVGQGALAVECRENDVDILALLQPLHDGNTLLRILAERSFLRTLGGGCSAPVAVTSTLSPFEDKYTLELSGAVWSLDGKTELRDTERCTVELRSFTKAQGNAEPVCPLGFTRESAGMSSGCGGCPMQKTCEKKKLSCPYEAAPSKKIKLDHKENENKTETHKDPHEHCPLDIPVGLDFMGKCPYLSVTETDSVAPEVENLIHEFGASTDKCPYLEGKINVVDDIPNEILPLEKVAAPPMMCPYREPKLYCGIVPCRQTPLWALEQAEHLGMNLAETLSKRGALDVMHAAQATIRGN